MNKFDYEELAHKLNKSKIWVALPIREMRLSYVMVIVVSFVFGVFVGTLIGLLIR